MINYLFLGLVVHYNHLKDNLFPKWRNHLSLADYAVLSAYEAFKAGVQANTGCDGGQCSIDLPFTSGRRTCANPESPPTNTVFPKGHDAASPRTFLQQGFGLTENEMVALLGTTVTFPLVYK